MSDLSGLPASGPGCAPGGVTDQEGKDAFHLRFGTATKQAVTTGSVNHPVNTDLTPPWFPNGLGSYSKGLQQTSPGIVNPTVFKAFLEACGLTAGAVKPGAFDNAAIVRGGAAKLNGPRGAFAFQNVGKDSHGFGAPTVPAAPALQSIEYAVELVELYWASLLRDTPFEAYDSDATAQAAAKELTHLNTVHPGSYAGPLVGGKVTPAVLFRGGLNAQPSWFAGEIAGPYLSQFALIPTSLGRLPIDQKITTFDPGQAFMTSRSEWFNVQQGKPPAGIASLDAVRRYMRNGRDTAAYTQVDELYQAYLVAYLVAGTIGIGPNPGSPYLGYSNDKAFGAFGGPDISSTLAAVARAAINAVWYQKWSVHLRHRPEAGGGIVELLANNALDPADKAKLANFDIVLNSKALAASRKANGSALLSQTFPEGSPTHPAYPTGHGTVAGACITVLKFFMNGEATFTRAVTPSADGLSLAPYPDPALLTVNGELHKLAHNISFGHGIHAGIHWRSDTDYSILLGEAVAIQYLKDQMYSYQENFDITITTIDGSPERFKNF